MTVRSGADEKPDLVIRTQQQWEKFIIAKG